MSNHAAGKVYGCAQPGLASIHTAPAAASSSTSSRTSRISASASAPPSRAQHHAFSSTQHQHARCTNPAAALPASLCVGQRPIRSLLVWVGCTRSKHPAASCAAMTSVAASAGPRLFALLLSLARAGNFFNAIGVFSPCRTAAVAASRMESIVPRHRRNAQNLQIQRTPRPYRRPSIRGRSSPASCGKLVSLRDSPCRS